MLDFVCIGAQKAATTWLYSQLEGHAEVSFPLGKEAHYWDWVQKGKRPARPDWYRTHFSGDTPQRKGDMTPAYALLDTEGIREMYSMYPGVKAFMLLRDPVDRAWSTVRMVCEASQLEPHEITEPFMETIALAQSTLQKGDYESTLRRWRAVLGKENVKVWLYEDVRDHPTKLLGELASYLGISNEWSNIERSKLLERRVRQGPKIAIPNAIEHQLRAYYNPKVHSLASYLQVDLSGWLAV